MKLYYEPHDPVVRAKDMIQKTGIQFLMPVTCKSVELLISFHSVYPAVIVPDGMENAKLHVRLVSASEKRCWIYICWDVSVTRIGSKT